MFDVLLFERVWVQFLMLFFGSGYSWQCYGWVQFLIKGLMKIGYSLYLRLGIIDYYGMGSGGGTDFFCQLFLFDVDSVVFYL